ncbi:Vitamin B12 transporter BtuB [Oligella sp. MSHR50489EDL]|uniref:TonB-dependent receptor domain-containing protein n=1 Tax=Oligella sp. MSHR50489EDL TaxID=3139409 RepID=UPI003D819C29
MHNKLFKLVKTTVLINSFGVSISFAAQTSPDPKIFSLPDIYAVSTSERTELMPYTKAGSYNYLNSKEIERFRGSSVGDFLSGIPGVIIGNKRNSGALSVNIRGLQNENRVPVSIDDTFQAIPSWQGYAGSSTRTYLDPDLVSTVEVEKGPSLAGDSVGATGGMVRMKTISYSDVIPEDSDKNWGFRLRLGTMSNTTKRPDYYTRGGYRTKWISECLTNSSGLCQVQTYEPPARYASSNIFSGLGKSYNSSLAFASKWDNADLVLAYAKKYQGNYFAGKRGAVPEIDEIVYQKEPWIEMGEDDEGDTIYEDVLLGLLKFKKQDGYTYYRSAEEVLNTSQNNDSYLAKLNLYNENHALSLVYRGYRSEFGELLPSLISFRGDGALQGEGTEVKVDSYGLKYNFNPVTPYINFTANAYLTRSDSSNFTPFFEEYGYSDSRHAYFTVSTQKGLLLQNISDLNIADMPLRLTYGLGISVERIHPPGNMDSRVSAKGYPKNAVAPLYIRDAKRHERTAFLSLNFKPLKWLEIDAGTRYLSSQTTDNQPITEFLGYDDNGQVIKKITYTPPIKNRGFSHIGMVTFKPNDSVNIYAKYAEALRSPSLFQASRGFSMQKTDDEMFGLRPEKQKNWELGVNTLFQNVFSDNDYLGLKFAFFNNYTKDYLARTFSKKSHVLQTRNIDSALYRGIEAQAYYDMNKFYAQIGFNHYLKTRFCHDLALGQKGCYEGGVEDSNIGNTLPPKNTLTLVLGTRLFDSKLDTGVRYSYYGKRIVSVFSPSEAGGDTKSAEWKPYGIVDFYASYNVTKNLNLSMAIDNITNKYYLDANNMGLVPAPGRTLRLNLDYRF